MAPGPRGLSPLTLSSIGQAPQSTLPLTASTWTVTLISSLLPSLTTQCASTFSPSLIPVGQVPQPTLLLTLSPAGPGAPTYSPFHCMSPRPNSPSLTDNPVRLNLLPLSDSPGPGASAYPPPRTEFPGDRYPNLLSPHTESSTDLAGDPTNSLQH